MKKYLKIFVVCFCLVALLTVSCFATSAQNTNVVYGHYISPGEYVWNSTLSVPVRNFSILFSFTSSGLSFYGVSVELVSGNVLVFLNDITYHRTVYSSDSWTNENYRHITISEGFYIYDSRIFQWFQSNIIRVSPGYSSNLLDGFLTVFSNIGVWISSAAASLTSMFFAEGSLTFLGTLCIAALAMAVSFLLIGFISRFLRFRG